METAQSVSTLICVIKWSVLLQDLMAWPTTSRPCIRGTRTARRTCDRHSMRLRRLPADLPTCTRALDYRSRTRSRGQGAWLRVSQS